MKSFNHNSGQYFSIDKAKIYYEEIGMPTQPILLLLHGGFGTIENFNPIIPDLFDKYRIIGIDSRGQGKSTTGNENLTYELLQNDVEALLHYLNIESLSIIGFSDGGIVAFPGELLLLCQC
ncbi:MAG: alpha/beta hydrolase [Chitinophagaceae bacterium]